MFLKPNFLGRCWWCGTELSKFGFANSTDRLGNKVKVHISCKENCDADAKPFTAVPPGYFENER